MKTIKFISIITLLAGAAGCTQDIPELPAPSIETQQIPNGDFETWSSYLPVSWQTNSCPACVPPYEAYVVQQDTDAYQGQFAAKFIYNNVFRATAVNGFSISSHPATLKAYVKSNMVTGDTVTIGVKLFLNNFQVDDGEWQGTASISNYMQIQVPVSQSSGQADSIAISIEGGKVSAFPAANTELWVDAMTLE